MNMVSPESIDHSNDGVVYEFVYPENEMDEPSMTILEVIAWAKNTDPRELPPLSESINPDALNELLVSTNTGESYRSPDNRTSQTPQVYFEYEGFMVTVKPGRFTIERL